MKAVPLSLVFSFAVIGASVPIAGVAQPVEIREGVLFEKNVPIPTDDGALMMSNLFRPGAAGRYPALLSMSIYGKDIHTRDFIPEVWEESTSTSRPARDSSCTTTLRTVRRKCTAATMRSTPGGSSSPIS